MIYLAEKSKADATPCIESIRRKKCMESPWNTISMNEEAVLPDLSRNLGRGRGAYATMLMIPEKIILST